MIAISHSKENPFKRYLDYLKEMRLRNMEEELPFRRLGREFINLLETTNMSKISDKEHIKKIMQMPVHFLQESGKGFFIKKDGVTLSMREEL